MKIYKVIQGQNIYDVAMTLFGSLEGVLDLLACNDDLSFATQLKGGDELLYHDTFIVNPQVVSLMQNNSLVSVNEERKVYYKACNHPLTAIFYTRQDTQSVIFNISGDGVMYIDWGDDSFIEEVALQPTLNKIEHTFDIPESCIKIYGAFDMKHFDVSGVNGKMFLTKPLTVDEFVSCANNVTLDALLLFKGTYSVRLEHMSIRSLDFIKDMSLSNLVLTNNVYADEGILDNYFIYIAKNHNQRRSCKITIDKPLSGIYQEPPKDTYGNYIISSGMEAVYVITHEQAWNEAEPWVFDICGKVYKYQNSSIA